MLGTALAPAVRAAWLQMRRAPVRSFLVLQGVMWSTVLGILPPAVVRGSREAAFRRALELGMDRIAIHDMPQGDAAPGPGLTWDLPAVLVKRFDGRLHAAVAAAHQGPLLLVDSADPRHLGWKVSAGRWFLPEELSRGEPVCLISPAHAAERFAGGTALGQTLELEGSPARLQVIGLAEPLRRDAGNIDRFGYRRDHPLHGLAQELLEHLGVFGEEQGWLEDAGSILAPQRAAPEVRPQLLLLRAEPDEVARLAHDARLELTRMGLNPVVSTNPMAHILFSGQVKVLRKMELALFTICLIAGTVIVVNINILSILERRREIAIRRVEGATARTIALQFLFETAACCVFGAIAGIPLALGLAWLRTSIDPSGALHWIFPVPETLQTIACAGGLGILGGILPALRAARVDPARTLSRA